MFFSRLVFSVFAVGAIAAVASPAPVVEKREDLGTVLSVIGTLDSRTSAATSQLDALVNGNTATASNVEPLVAEISRALTDAESSFKALEGRVDQTKGGSKEQVANSVAGVYTKIGTSLDNLKTKKPHIYYPVVPKFGLDLALYKLLLGLNILVAGVLVLVASLLKVVGGLLSSLGLTLLILLLGLGGGHY